MNNARCDLFCLHEFNIYITKQSTDKIFAFFDLRVIGKIPPLKKVGGKWQFANIENNS